MKHIYWLLSLFLLCGCNRIPDYPKYIELKKDLIIKPPEVDEYGTTSIFELPKGTRIYYKTTKEE